MDYILPFLVLVSIGVIGVLGFQLWSNWDQQGKGDVYFYVAEGKAKLLPYGQTDWDNAFSGTKLLLGDSIKSSMVGKVVLAFFNGTIIRMNDDTAVTLTDLSKAADKETIVMNLANGSVWVNGKKSAGVKEALYEIRTTNLLVKAKGTVFEVESEDGLEVVRVFDGEVNVDVMIKAGGSERVADTISVGVGQEITIDEATLSAFADNKSTSVLTGISDDFKDTDWYKWNVREDKSPTDFKLTPGITEMEATSDVSLDESSADDELSTEEDVDATDDGSADDEDDTLNNDISDTEFPSPKILKPTATTVSEGTFVISGTVGADAEKIIVESNAGGTKDSYTLSQFKKGDTSWSYNVSDKFGNIKPGDNTYNVYAVYPDDEESEPAKITITYNKEAETVEGDLTDPVVNTFNGLESSTVTTGLVTVSGTIKGADKVVVNNYTLTKFSPGDTSWAYIASESGGNLKAGKNEYEVYGVDPDGNKSAAVKFTITYDKAEAAESDTANTSDEPATEDTTTEESSDAASTDESTDDEIPYGF